MVGRTGRVWRSGLAPSLSVQSGRYCPCMGKFNTKQASKQASCRSGAGQRTPESRWLRAASVAKTLSLSNASAERANHAQQEEGVDPGRQGCARIEPHNSPFLPDVKLARGVSSICLDRTAWIRLKRTKMRFRQVTRRFWRYSSYVGA